MSCLIVFKSITYAQNAQGIYAKNGIITVLTRPPLYLGKGSCSYGLKIAEKDLGKARSLLANTRIAIVGIYRMNIRGNYEEV